MKHIGLDVAVKETAVCIVDESGRICREVKVVSHCDGLLAVLKDPALTIERVGIEAGPNVAMAFRGAGVRRLLAKWTTVALPTTLHFDRAKLLEQWQRRGKRDDCDPFT